MSAPKEKFYFDWVDAMKAFAILGILLVHLVEEFGPKAWFTNPSDDWPDFNTRLHNFIPDADNWFERIIYFLGWLGDSGPGVFILLSGFGLAFSTLQKPESQVDLWSFYRRRLLRIFPLYLTIHFFTVLGALFVLGPGSIDLNIDTLLSFMGLRFKDSIFFYINPSWWFIWLILQLYIVFPFLFRLMKKVGVTWFFLITLGFTIASRGAGIMGIRYSSELFSWMTGIFFGTRLAEFSLGMVLAAVLLHDNRIKSIVPRLSWFLPLSLFIYFLGLFASIVWIGTLISNLLVTVGLCGVFYSVWEWGIKGRLGFLMSPIIWIGVNSFGVFLLHQSPLIWAGELIGNPSLHLIAGLLIIGLSFPVALGIEKFVAKATNYFMSSNVGQKTMWLTGGAVILLFGVLAVLEPTVFSPFVYQLGATLIIAFILYLMVLELKIPIEGNFLIHWLFLTAIFASVLKIFIFPSGYGMFSIALGVAVGGGIVLFYLLTKRRWLAWGLSFSIFGIILLFTEAFLRFYKPLETPVQWGEYPALESHPTRFYGLKPDLNIHLKYNNYSYVLQTNSQGLASPEINAERPDSNTLRILITGDAFSMPEGMEYEFAYPSLLEKELKDSLGGRSVQVINGGVTGYGPVESLHQIEELIPINRPDILIYQFFINEFEEINTTQEDRLRSIGLISDLSRIEKEIYGSQILAYERKYERKIKEIIRGKSSGYRYDKSLLRFYRKDSEVYENGTAVKRTKEILSEMKNICRENGVEFLLVFVPGQVAVSAPEDIAYFPREADLSDTTLYDMDLPLKLTKGIADSLDISIFDLTPYLKNAPNQPVYFRESWHWNQEGHQSVAKAIFEELQKRRII